LLLNSIEIKRKFEEALASEIRKSFSETITDLNAFSEEIHNSISTPRPEQGDLSSSICFALAKLAKKSPTAIAHEISSKLEADPEKEDFISRIKDENGYINLWLDEAKYSKHVLEAILSEKEKYGISRIGSGRKVIIEFPSVNPNKPWHIGHLRNALLGDSISRIFEANSYTVEREDYIDDLGLQMAEILWGRDKISDGNAKKYDTLLGEAYVEINKEITEKHAEKDINEILKRMEDTSSSESVEIRKISEKSVKAQYLTAFSYGIYHDVLIWESDIVREKLLKRAMDFLDEKKITQKCTEGKYAGCVIIADKEGSKHASTEEEDEESRKVLIRSNGVATYLAKDLAFHMWKLGIIDCSFNYSEFIVQPNGKEAYTSSEKGKPMNFGNADIAINIIGAAQQHPQNLLKRIFEEVTGEQRILHLSYGEVSVKGGTLSGRKGGWIGTTKSYTADSLLAEMEKMTFGIVSDAKKPRTDIDMKEVSHKVALAAIKFEFLKTDPEKKVLFEWDKALDLNSNSGPYCMYMYARASRILERAGIDKEDILLAEKDFKKITRGEDFTIIKQIGRMQETVEKACREYKPSIIAAYVMELSLIFSNFYEKMPVLSGEEYRNLRTGIVMAVKQALFNMLCLINIDTAERM
jgi:arginyl-tRNA synthetase